MENTNFLQNTSTRLDQNVTVENVNGKRLIAGNKTIIPVVQIK